MSDPNSQLTSVRTAVASVTDGHDVNQDAWMAMWCNTNWGALLQPAPLSISLLGSILIIASATDDFSLITDTPKGCPAFKWKYAAHPDSFKTCLEQMVGDGYTAYETAADNMEKIQNLSGQIPDVIEEIVDLILKGSADDIGRLFPGYIGDLKDLSKKSGNAAKDIQKAFDHLAGLAQEMVLGCTYKAGTAEQALNQNSIHVAVLQVQEAQQAKMVSDAKKATNLMTQSYKKAEDAYYTAVKNVPSGNAFVSRATMSSQAEEAGIAAFSSVVGDKKDDPAAAASTTPTVPATSSTGVATQPNNEALLDPGTTEVQRVLDQVNNIKLLLTGNNGKPDWDKIRSEDPKVTTGASYVESSLDTLKSSLEENGPFSAKLSPIIDQAEAIVKQIIKVGGEISQADNDDALANQVEPTNDLIDQLTALVAAANLVLQQPGTASTGPATPPPSSSSGSSGSSNSSNSSNDVVQQAVQNARAQVDQTRSNLDAARKSYQQASQQLVTQQQAITQTIGEMTQLKLTDTSLRQLLPVLQQAVGAFTTLRAQLSQLVQFFDSIDSLLVDVMGPSIKRWIQTVTEAEQPSASGGTPTSVAGVTISAFIRDLIYRQMMVPVKVSYLSNQIASTYLDVSNSDIMPAQRAVGSMLKFNTGDQAEFQAQLAKAQSGLAAQASKASQQISNRVKDDQKEFEAKIEARVTAIVNATKEVLPQVKEPVAPVLQNVVDSHVADFTQLKKEQAQQNPMFNPADAM